jgi:hypothetical protein
MATENLTMVEMTEADIAFAERIANRLRYTQTTYTTGSALLGLFCLRDSDKDRKPNACVIKTKELGFMVVSDLEDLCLHDLAEEERNNGK